MSIVELSSLDAVKLQNQEINHCDFTVKLRKPLSDIVALQLLSAVIPFSWNIINDGNNVFPYIVNNTNKSITIPEGTYNAHVFADKLSELFQANGDQISVDYDNSNDDFTFTSNAAFTFPNTNQELCKILGFKFGTSQVGTTLKTVNAPQLTGDNTLNLEFKNLFLDVQNTSNGNSSSIQVPINANPRGVIGYFKADDNDIVNFQIESNITELKVRLKYFDNVIIGGSKNLRGLPIYLKLKFFHKNHHKV